MTIPCPLAHSQYKPKVNHKQNEGTKKFREIEKNKKTTATIKKRRQNRKFQKMETKTSQTPYNQDAGIKKMREEARKKREMEDKIDVYINCRIEEELEQYLEEREDSDCKEMENNMHKQ